MFLQKLFRLSCLAILSFCFISASYAPNLESSKEDNRGKKEQAETRQEKRLANKKARINKKLNKLSFKLDKVKKAPRKKHLEKRIYSLKQKQSNDNRNPIWGVLPLGFGILAVIALVFLLLGLFFISSSSGALILFLGWLGAIFFSIAAIVLGIIGIKKTSRESEKFSLKGLSIGGVILGGGVILTILILLILFFILLTVII